MNVKQINISVENITRLYDEKKYELVLVEVNFVGSSFKVRLKELHGAIPNLSTSP